MNIFIVLINGAVCHKDHDQVTHLRIGSEHENNISSQENPIIDVIEKI